MKATIHVIEIDEQPIPIEWEAACGSHPRRAGDKIEGHVVPEGKIWLMPVVGRWVALERLGVRGVRKTFEVEL